MVSVDLDIKKIITLAENNSIDKKQLKEFLDQFDKDEIIEYLCSSVYDIEEEETTQEDTQEF